LAGLIEGDGSIIVPKTNKNEKGKYLYPRIKITFVKKDEPLAKKIKNILGSGTFEYPKDTNYVNLLFQDLQSFKKLAVLLNGKFRTPKIESLHRLIDWLNIRYSSSNLTKLGLDESPLSDNSWLSGFIEADGNFFFDFSINPNGVAKSLHVYMRISQKISYMKDVKGFSLDSKSNYPVMDKIKNFLDVKSITNIKRIKKDFTEFSYEVRTTRKESSDKLINYLSLYPLFSSKFLDFSDWSEVHKIRISKDYKKKTTEGISKLISLKNGMNNLRTHFNWDHLDNFYKI
jgi:hypothetical protein